MRNACTCMCSCVCLCRLRRVCVCLHVVYSCVSVHVSEKSVCMCASTCVSGIPVMIDPRLSPSTLTHQCCFKCPSPWKQAAGIQVWYTDNGLPLFLSLPLCLALSLSLSTPAALPVVYPIFSLAPSFLSRSIFQFFLSCLDFHSFMSVFPLQGFPPPFSLSLFSFSLTFLPLSQFIDVNLAAMLSHLCLSLLSSLSPLVTSSSSSFSLHPSLSTYASSPLILSISICSFCPSFLSRSSVCGYGALMLNQTQTHTNAHRGLHHSTQLQHGCTCFNHAFIHMIATTHIICSLTHSLRALGVCILTNECPMTVGAV